MSAPASVPNPSISAAGRKANTAGIKLEPELGIFQLCWFEPMCRVALGVDRQPGVDFVLYRDLARVDNTESPRGLRLRALDRRGWLGIE